MATVLLPENKALHGFTETSCNVTFMIRLVIN